MRFKHVRAGAMVLSLLILMPIGIQMVESQHSGPSIIVEFLQIVEDATFNSPPSYAINGSADEFTMAYQNSTGGEDYNRAILNWTHTANNPLDFRPPPDYDYPECNDFVYLYEELTWDYEIEPQDIYVKIEYRVNFTGDFSPSINPEGEEMAKVHIWFIDPSGYWCVVESFKVYTSNLYEKLIYISQFEVAEIFRGMIEDSAGAQEDPTDKFSLCVGLAPSDTFRNFSSTEPWRTYNGSVMLELSRLELHVAADIVDNVVDTLPIVANQTWVSPHYEFRSYFDMASDGSVYGVTTTSNYEKGISQHSLVKWDQTANILWNVTWNETRYTLGRGISIHEDYIYTTGREISEDGTENMFIAKWNTHGILVWNRVIDTGMNEFGTDIEVDNDGNFYLLGFRDLYIEETEEYVYDTFFIKYDAAGNQLWNSTSDNWLVDHCRIYIHPDGTLFTLDFPDDGLYKWTSDGSPIMVTDESGLYDIAFSPNGDVYVSKLYGDEPDIRVEKINETGQLEVIYIYNYTASFQEPWYPICRPDALTITNDSIYLIVKHANLNYYYELFKIDLEGTKIWNKTILDLNWKSLFSPSSSFYLEFNPNGLLYIGGSIITAAGNVDIGLAILNPEDAPYPPSIPSSTIGGNWIFDNPLIFIMLIGGGVGAVVVILIYFKKLKG